ncbi:unnamed protein product [Phytophthora lilii]|uniref:Unnamed protein product n=1 Tax=Phytophthora lilii TaxID=2077276 RepID=A0A9W6TSH7_9STRA|nr:unnamed protein product [Phytophthora lilii]
MESKAATSSLARDADGKALMTLEELKEGMFQTIRDNGTVELIRQQRQLTDDPDDENNASRVNRGAGSSTPDEKLVHGLVAEYLATKGLENTLAVFVPEIGGSRNQVDSATVLQRVTTGQSLLLVLVRELIRRFQLATMDSGTQTAMDCFDHRIVLGMRIGMSTCCFLSFSPWNCACTSLENQLRRVENTYLAECAIQRLEPQKSLEERMVQYQREYDDICDKRLQEELDRYKSTEVALVRAEERKRFDREIDNLRSSLMQEYHDKQERLQERERDVELAFVARRTELETSLFETRQSLFKDMERLRVKEAELQVKVESDFRHFASETQRFQLWEESVRTQEANLEGIVAQAMREKEREWNIARQKALDDIQTKQEELIDRERSLTTETGTLKTLKTQVVALQQEVTALEAALSHEKEKSRLEERVVELELQLTEQNASLKDASAANARLAADKSITDDELARYKRKNTEAKEQVTLLSGDIKSLQQQILSMKLEEANAVVAERKKFMQMMDEERERSRWKENELFVKLRELQSHLADAEALAEKYQSQYEDEKVHVESLRHDVSSLNSLLTQAQATINAKHGMPRDLLSFRSQRSPVINDMVDNRTHVSSDDPMRGGNERTFMMKMMEMMTNFQDERAVPRNTTFRDQTQPANTVRGEPSIPVHQVQETIQEPIQTTYQSGNEDLDEAKRLKEDQARIERELLDQREYEKKKQARMEEQERELAEQHRQFEEKMARIRQERIEEEERLEEQRKRKQAEEEAKVQEELARQRFALQEASELQQKLTEQRLAEEQRRIQEEQAYQERKREEERKFNEEVEAKRREQQIEDEVVAKQKLEREQEEFRLRQEREAKIEQGRIQIESDAKAVFKATQQKQKIDREQENLVAPADEEQKDKSEEDFEREDNASGTESLTKAPGAEEDEDVNSSNEKVMVAPDIAAKGVKDELPTGIVESVNVCDDTTDNLLASAVNAEDDQQIADEVDEIPLEVKTPPLRTPEEEEEERQKAAEEAKKKEDENVIDVYRQRVLARKAAEKQRQEAAETERKAKEEEERQRLQFLAEASDQELELSGGSFADSRQLDMSTWSVDSSPASAQDSSHFRTGSGTSRDSDNFNYSRAREASSRFEISTGNEYRSRAESTSMREGQASRTAEFDSSSFSSDRNTIGGSTFDTTFSAVSSRDVPRGDSISERVFRPEQGGRRDNQREIDNYTRGSRNRSESWNLENASRGSDRSRRSFRSGIERSDEQLAHSTYAGEEDRISNNRFELRFSSDKADSIREAESPVASREEYIVTNSSHADKEPIRTTPAIETSIHARSFENQEEPRSPTNSEPSIPPSSPVSDCDSVAQRIQDRYPKPLIPSPLSDSSASRIIRASSPCSSVATSRTSASRASTTTRTKHLTPYRKTPEPAMSDLREDLYAFRKQMREVFIQVEDVVDVHRSFFKSDPSTGSPVFNSELQQEAEQLANKAFEHLADLRDHFTRLAKDFKRSQKPADEWPRQERRRRAPNVPTMASPTPAQRSQISDDESTSHESYNAHEDATNDALERLSADSGGDAQSTIERSPTVARGGRSTSQVDSDDDGRAADSVRSTASTFQLPSRFRVPESTAASDTTRSRAHSPSDVSDTSLLPDQCTKPGSPHSLFQGEPVEPIRPLQHAADCCRLFC